MTDKEKRLISDAMSLLGSIRSDKKAAASRANGMLGGYYSHKKTREESDMREAVVRATAKRFK